VCLAVRSAVSCLARAACSSRPSASCRCHSMCAHPLQTSGSKKQSLSPKANPSHLFNERGVDFQYLSTDEREIAVQSLGAAIAANPRKRAATVFGCAQSLYKAYLLEQSFSAHNAGGSSSQQAIRIPSIAAFDEISQRAGEQRARESRRCQSIRTTHRRCVSCCWSCCWSCFLLASRHVPCASCPRFAQSPSPLLLCSRLLHRHSHAKCVAAEPRPRKWPRRGL